MQIKFDRIQAGSLPPKFTHVNAEAGARDNMVRFFFFGNFQREILNVYIVSE